MEEQTASTLQTPEFEMGVEIQGNHSFQPPEEIVPEVRTWLERLIPMITDFPLPDKIRFTLQIECRKIPAARNFYGVQAVCLAGFNIHSLELRVRPKRSQNQWACHLICQSHLAVFLLDHARPEAAKYVHGFMDHDVLRFEELATTHKHRSHGLHQKVVARDVWAKLANSLMKRELVRKLCFLLEGDISPNNTVTATQIRDQASIICGQQLNSETLEIYLRNLVAGGAFEPADNSGKIFSPTMVFEDYSDTHRQEQRKKQLDSLRNRVATLVKLRDAALREHERFKAKAATYLEHATTLSDKLSSSQKELDLMENDDKKS